MNKKQSKSGYIYILTNRHFKDGIVKIGFTRRDPKTRAFELYEGSTGVPGKFDVAFSVLVSDCVFTESKIHELLAQFRVNEYREFFNVPLPKAIELTARVSAIVNERFVECPSCCQLNRIPSHGAGRNPVCGKCGANLS